MVRLRRTRAGPILAAFADWLDVHHRSATPKSLFSQAVAYARNQWGSLVRYLDDARFALDNGATERAIRPLAIGRANWLHVGGDGGLKTASVLLSVCASATRHRLNPWAYLHDVLDQLTLRSPVPTCPTFYPTPRPGADSPPDTRHPRTSEPTRLHPVPGGCSQFIPDHAPHRSVTLDLADRSARGHQQQNVRPAGHRMWWRAVLPSAAETAIIPLMACPWRRVVW